MKTAKRILSVLLLIILGLLVGYLCYTGSRLSSGEETNIVSQYVEYYDEGGINVQ